MIDPLLRIALRIVLGLRYRVRLAGAAAVAARGTRGILFLPNHPALIDPIILGVYLHRPFRPRFLADAEQVDRPVIRGLARRIRAVTIPDTGRLGAAAAASVHSALDLCAAALRAGDNLVIYPAGQIQRSRCEELASKSAAHDLLHRVPEARAVLVRTSGLWGSSFSRAAGEGPLVGPVLARGLAGLLKSGLFFGPRRRVEIELAEPAGLPRGGDRDTFNRYLEAFYNARARPRTHVPLDPWERGGTRVLPEPPRRALAGDTAVVPGPVRARVLARLRELAGRERCREEDLLGRDLGLDSLALAELLAWIEGEFGATGGDVAGLQTVADLLLAAAGEGIAGAAWPVPPPPPRWFGAEGGGERLRLPPGETLLDLFLAAARRHPGRPAVADGRAGLRTYRDLVAGILALRPSLRALPGERVGVMLPASAAADLVFLALLFAGRVPVMVNWTVGPRPLDHGLATAGVERVISAGPLLERLARQGTELGEARARLLLLEDLAGRIGRRRRLAAFLRARLGLLPRSPARPRDEAAVLFTSGSEALPKAVPLTQAALVANLRDLVGVVALREGDRLLGMLPPFHSFGLTVGLAMPLSLGLPVVHHPNPTEAPALARTIAAYRATLVVGTPTFLSGILRATQAEELSSLRLVVTGAEACPERVYEAFARRCPGAVVLEGYGITECAPAVAVNDESSPRRGTIGRVLPSFSWLVVDPESLEPVPPGRRGLLLVRGPCVFGGYLAPPAGEPPPVPFVEAAGASWYATGDLVTAAADGVLTFQGRLKRFVKVGGEMISLPAIEAALHDSLPPPEGDEGPRFAVVAGGGGERPELVLFTVADLDRETANRKLREAGLSLLHNLRRVERVAALPLLGTGKTDYRALADRLREPDGPGPP